MAMPLITDDGMEEERTRFIFWVWEWGLIYDLWNDGDGNCKHNGNSNRNQQQHKAQDTSNEEDIRHSNKARSPQSRERYDGEIVDR